MICEELYVSVDVESSGPIPGVYRALAVSGLDLGRLTREGLAPGDAMRTLEQWLKLFCSVGRRVVFVGLNTPFDWSFINYYFHKYLGAN